MEDVTLSLRHSHRSTFELQRPPREPRRDPVFFDLPRPLPDDPRPLPWKSDCDLDLLGWYSSSVHRGQSLKPGLASDCLDRYSSSSGSDSDQLKESSRNREPALSLGWYPSSGHRFPSRKPGPWPASLGRYSSVSVQPTLSSPNPGRAPLFLGPYPSSFVHSRRPSL